MKEMSPELLASLKEAKVSVAYNRNPQDVWQSNPKFTAPLPDDEAKMLRQRMTARYYAWTGRDLWAVLNEDRRT